MLLISLITIKNQGNITFSKSIKRLIPMQRAKVKFDRGITKNTGSPKNRNVKGDGVFIVGCLKKNRQSGKFTLPGPKENRL